MQFEGDAAKLLREQDKMLRKQQEQIDKLKMTVSEGKKVQRQLDDTSTSGQRVFSNLTREIGKFAASFLSVQGGIAATKQALAALDAERQKLSGGIERAGPELALLASVADEQFSAAQLRQFAREGFATGAAPSLAQSAAQIRAIQSAGLTRDRAIFQRLVREDQVTDLQGFAAATRAVNVNLGGSTSEIIAEAVAAGAFSPATAQEILIASARGAGTAARLGISRAELLAATSIAATAIGSAEEGGTQISGLLEEFAANPQLLRGGFLQSVTRLGALPVEQLTSTLGNVRARRAVAALASPLARTGERIAEVQAAVERDVVATLLQEGAQDPVSIAARELRVNRAAAEAAGEKSALRRTEALAREEDVVEKLRDLGASDFEVVVARFGQWVDRLLGIESELTLLNQLHAEANKPQE